MTPKPVRDVLASFSGVKQSGAGWSAKCPAHEDRCASLSIGQGDDGTWLVKCHAGCNVDAVLAAAHLELRDLFPTSGASTGRDIVATYDYTDEKGVLRYQVVRFQPKDFRQRRPDGHGGWTWSTKGLQPLVYRRPDLQGRETVIVAEGEKDVNRLWDLGLPATCNHGGAGKWKAPHTAQLVAAGTKRVAVIPDADTPGQAHGQAVAQRCLAAGLTVKLVSLPDGAHDVSAYLAAGGTKAALMSLIQQTATFDAGTETTSPPDPSALSCDALLVEHELSALETDVDRGVLDTRLRALVVALQGSDRLRVALVRDALMTQLKAAKIQRPAVIVDAAFLTESITSEARQGAPLLLADVEPWPTPVDGAAVLETVIKTITGFIVLPSHGAVALALWILHTYLMDAWWLSPLAVATSPTRRCGKTALLTVVSELAYRPLAASNISPAALFRSVEKYRPTLMLDEAETWLKTNEALRGIVNAGHTRRTVMVIRTVGDDHEPATFSTWCAKFIALIGELPDTLMDRAIVIEMRRKTATERVERLRLDQLPAVCEPLQRQMARWAVDHEDGLAAADPEIPAGLHDRAADNWRPLLALSDTLGGEWPTRARGAANMLAGVDQEDAIGVQLLWDIKDAFADEPVLSSKAIIDALVAMDDRPWATWSRQDKPLTTHGLARLLRKFRIVPAGNIRVGDKVRKSYQRAAFVDSWARYQLQSATRNKSNKDGGETDISECYTEDECSTLKTAVEPMNTGFVTCSGLDQEGEAPQEENQAPSTAPTGKSDAPPLKANWSDSVYLRARTAAVKGGNVDASTALEEAHDADDDVASF